MQQKGNSNKAWWEWLPVATPNHLGKVQGSVNGAAYTMSVSVERDPS